MNVLAVDPGGTTGVAMLLHDQFSASEHEGFDAALEHLSWLTDPFIGSRAWDAIVCESFVIRKNTHKLDSVAFNTTTDLIGACRTVASQARVTFVRQSPSEAKSFASDSKLRRLGWYTPTPGGHANDAARHLLTYLARQKHYPTLAKLTEDQE